MEMDRVMQIGLLGLGTVGSGVVKSLESNQAHIQARTGCSVQIKRALVRDLDKPRRVSLPKEMLTLYPQEVVQDQGIHIVVEVMGGIEPARTLILQSLRSGKHVITANKELLAKCGEELIGVAHAQGVRLLFEASVAGGVPIIRMVESYLLANRIMAIRGILNGTCNYILTQMEEQGESFASALSNAQKLGYAEADPESDVEGYDAAYKLSILANMAFPVRSDIRDVKRTGITSICPIDVNVAKSLGAVIKLIGQAVYDNGHVQLAVGPRMLSKNDSLGSVRDVFNAVTLSADVVGDLTLIGRGAGELPTASAVIEDLMEVLHSPHPRSPRPRLEAAPEAAEEGVETLLGVYYARIHAESPIATSDMQAAEKAMATLGVPILVVSPPGSASCDHFVLILKGGKRAAEHYVSWFSSADVLCLPFDAEVPQGEVWETIS